MSSMREGIKDHVKLMHSTSYSSQKEKGEHSGKESKQTRNYSIINPRETSPVGFYAKSKISKPRYLSK